MHPFKVRELASSVIVPKEQRWAHVFPKAYQQTSNVFGPMWKSLCEPAQLPLTTLSPPFESDLLRTHDISADYPVINVSSHEHDSSKLKELDVQNFERIKMQRISQCFQYCDMSSFRPRTSTIAEGEADIHSLKPTRSKNTAPPTATEQTGSVPNVKSMQASKWPNDSPTRSRSRENSISVTDTNVWMGFGSLFHRLTFSLHESTVKVKIFRPKGLSFVPDRMDYQYRLLRAEAPGWVTCKSTFQTTSLVNYNWSYVDNQDITLDECDIDALRFWRVRLALITLAPRNGTGPFHTFLEDLNRICRPSDSLQRDRAGSDPKGRANQKTEETENAFSVEASQTEKEMPPTAMYLLSQGTKVDMDSRRQSDRVEWGDVQYDSHYCPNLVFHLEVRWLVATGCLVQELIDRWTKRAESRGFRMVPIPISDEGGTHVDKSPNPFRGPVHIRFDSALIPAFVKVSPATCQEQILYHFDFVKEVADLSAPRYLHRSGECYIQLVDDNTFAWSRNYMVTATGRGKGALRAAAKMSSDTDDTPLLHKLQQFCANEDAVVDFFKLVYPPESFMEQSSSLDAAQSTTVSAQATQSVDMSPVTRVKKPSGSRTHRRAHSLQSFTPPTAFTPPSIEAMRRDSTSMNKQQRDASRRAAARSQSSPSSHSPPLQKSQSSTT